MLLSHLFLEGVGPFKTLHLDLRGNDAHASAGPHILAGVNGSGKSTVLKSIAWCLATNDDGFPFDEWVHLLKSYPRSCAMVVFESYEFVWASTSDHSDGWETRLGYWVAERLAAVGLYTAAAYSSARAMKFVENLDMALPQDKTREKRFAFESTVQNEAIQSWLLALYSKRAIAKERHESSSRYTASFDALETGLKRICGEDVSIVVDIEPRFQPSLRIGDQVLNFSQIPDGVKTTLGWLADFMMRSDSRTWNASVADLKPGLLLFDEIEAFLHPLWQRRVLPALREALPNTQSIVTSHSPFVISSCASAVVHVLKVRSDGSAYVDAPAPAPIGESITSTLKEIFGVESRFDVQTEKELDEWNYLNRNRLEQKLDSKERARFQQLSKTLSERSEQLRALVDPVLKLPKSAVDELTGDGGDRPRRRRVASSR